MLKFNKKRPVNTKADLFDFTGYTNINDMIGYDGFIGYYGEFYRVRKIDDVYPIHDDWAKAYIEKYALEKKYYSDIWCMLEQYHFITVTYVNYKKMIDFSLPLKEIINEEQLNTARKLKEKTKKMIKRR